LVHFTALAEVLSIIFASTMTPPVKPSPLWAGHLVAQLEVSGEIRAYADLYRIVGEASFDADSLQAFSRIVPYLQRNAALAQLSPT
jgi:hypothetical protein